jgi:hypothetical protein
MARSRRWLRFGWVGLILLAGCTRPAVEAVPDLQERILLEGQVADDNGPLAGALVRLQGTAATTRTDAQGRFTLSPTAAARRVTAWKDGYFIGGAGIDEALQLRLRPLPAGDRDDYAWVNPDADPAGTHNCANCHGEVHREWAASGHARSATGRHFRNLYEGTDWNGKVGVGWGLLEQHPDGAAVCASCHAPAVPDGDEAGLDLRKVRGVAARGVHCDYCHKVRDAGPGQPGLTHGRFGLRLQRPAEGQLFFGPLDDVDRGEDAYAPIYRDSRYCASCHEGIVFGVPVYTTYSEWLESPARRDGRHCQDCHMKPTGRLTNLAPGKGGIERDPSTLGNHRFFDGSQADMLRRCVRVAGEVRPGADADSVRATVSVRVEGVGHRVPTGFIDRHLLLVVEGFGADGKPVEARSGPTLPSLAGEELTGKSGRLFGRVLKDFDGRSPAPFWRADSDPEDTRLVPGQVSESVFTFPPTLQRVRVRILYRRFWQEVARSKGWPDQDLVVFDGAFEKRPATAP